MPTALELLPSNLPAPTGRCQIKRGGSNANAVVRYNNTVAAGTKHSDGVGGFLEISVTPRYACYWLVTGNLITHGVNGSWQRMDWGIRITPNDVNGTSLAAKIATQCYDLTTVEWQTTTGSYMFRLAANTTYTAYLSFEYSSGFNQEIHCNQAWTRIMGRIIGESVL
jgi:hypothetical protein